MSCEYCFKPFDSIAITTTCGYVICKSHFDLSPIQMLCTMCDENHYLNVQECFKIPKNKKKLKEQEFGLKNQEFIEKKVKLETVLKDPLDFLNKSYESILRRIDKRREESKIEFSKMIDDLSDELIRKIKTEKEESFQKIIKINNNQTITPTTKLKDLEISIQYLNGLLEELDQIQELIEKPKKYELKLKEKREFNILDFFGNLEQILNLKEDSRLECIKIFNGHTDSVDQVILLEAENELVSCSRDETIKVWNLQTGECKRTLQKQETFASFIKIQTLENKIISCSLTRSIRIWDKNSGKLLKSLRGHSSYVSSLIVQSDQIISADYLGKIKIWQISNGKCLKTLIGQDSPITCLIYLNSNEFISAKKDIKIWDIEKGVCIKRLEGHDDLIYCLSLINSNELVSGSEDRTIKIWNLSTGDCIKTLEGHTDWVWCLEMLDKNQLISGSEDKTIKIWNIKEGKILKSFQIGSPINCLSVLSNGNFLAGLSNNSIKIFSLIN